MFTRYLKALDLTLYITFTGIGGEKATGISTVGLAERSRYRSLVTCIFEENKWNMNSWLLEQQISYEDAQYIYMESGLQHLTDK